MTTINDYNSLVSTIEYFSNSDMYLFRGQTKNYEKEDGTVSFLTSFERSGCIPSQRAKWEYYCNNAVKMILEKELYEQYSYDDINDFVEALFQHYGWEALLLIFPKI